ncbi:hypothetical protein V1478_013383 [Vespula squamosa]|uniref:Uncharacterized protein n=1 Tax=Vespula squamosa TaxID=30214 RepID=A0ABD2AAP1_VESSQ
MVDIQEQFSFHNDHAIEQNVHNLPLFNSSKGVAIAAATTTTTTAAAAAAVEMVLPDADADATALATLVDRRS